MEDFYFSPTAKLADLVLPSSDWAERCTYNEEIDGNMILTFDQAVEGSGRVLGRLALLPGMGQAHRSRALVVERREGHGPLASEGFYGYDLTWNEFQSTNVRSTEPGSENREIKKGVVAVPRPGWRDECPELGLPDTDGTRPTATSSFPPPGRAGYGATPMRSSLCKIEMGRGDLQ